MMGLGLGLGMSRGGAGRYAYNGNFAALRALPAGTTFTRVNAVSTYIDSAGLVQVAGANVPRFTYDPTTRASLGLMAEESRINILTYSRNMASAGFGLTNLTEAYGFAGIDGTANAVRLTVNSTTNTTNTKSYVATTTSCSVSCWMKKGNHAYEGTNLFIRNNTTSTTLASGALNFDTGVFSWSVNPGTGGTYRTEQFPEGWWRVSISYWGTGVEIAVGNTVHARIGGTGASLTSGSYLYFDGIQVEENPFPTSYMPTSGAAVTRSADVCSYTWADTAWQAAAFTVLAKWRQEVPTGTYAGVTRRIYEVRSTPYEMFLSQIDTSGNCQISTDGATALSIAHGAQSKFTSHRHAVKVASNSTRSAIDGGSVVADTTCTIYQLANMFIGSSASPSAFLNGTIAELKIPKRGFSDAELQAYQ